MINWFWVIPWVVIIIFYAGWHFGGKVATRKEAERRYREDADRVENRNNAEAISEIYRHLDNLENRIERIYATKATKEERNNG